jgi:hypothetical protein
VTTLRHHPLALDDELAHRMLPLLDGTRDAARLAKELGEERAAVEARLRHLAKLALVV